MEKCLIEEEQEEKIYTNVIDCFEDIEKLVDAAPKDRRSKEYKAFIKEYERLVNIVNKLSGNKLYNNKI